MSDFCDDISSPPLDWAEALIRRTDPCRYFPTFSSSEEQMETAKRRYRISHVHGLMINMFMCSCLGIAGTVSFHCIFIYSIVLSIVRSSYSDRVALSFALTIALAILTWFSLKMATSSRRVFKLLIKAEEERMLRSEQLDDDPSLPLVT